MKRTTAMAIVIISVVVVGLIMIGVLFSSPRDQLTVVGVAFEGTDNRLISGSSIIELNVSNTGSTSMQLNGIYINGSSNLLSEGGITTPVDFVSGQTLSITEKLSWIPNSAYEITLLAGEDNSYTSPYKFVSIVHSPAN